MVAAGVLGTLVVLAVLALRSVFITPLTRLFGGEGTIQKYASAQSTLALVSFVVAGVVAGVAIHLYARRTGNRLRIASTIGAGATAGVFTLVGLALTWVFDRQLISSAGGLDLGDQLAFHIAGMYQLNGGLALLFAGAIVALLLYGRTRGPRRPRRPKRPTSKPEWAVREERRAAELDRTARADSATGKTSTGNKGSAVRSATGKTGTGKAATGKSATAGKTTTSDKTSASGKGSAGDKNPASDKTATSGKGSTGGKNPTSGKGATSDKSSAGGKAGAGAKSSADGKGAGGKGAAGRKPGGNKSSGAKTAGATAPGGKTAGGTESGGTESGGAAGTAGAEGAAGADATDTGNASNGSTAQPAGNRRRART
jgi:hypothetical protein